MYQPVIRIRNASKAEVGDWEKKLSEQDASVESFERAHNDDPLTTTLLPPLKGPSHSKRKS